MCGIVSRGIVMPFRVKLLFLLVFVGMSSVVHAMDLGTPHLTEPLQMERFFDPERLEVQQGETRKSNPPLLEPQLAVSHDAREDDAGRGGKQTTHRVHGEAGGKLNLFGEVTLSAVAKIPVYSYSITDSTNVGSGTSSSEWLKNSGRLSWRSELGVPLREGVDLNLFYDRSTFGKVDRPGVDEREEKFGTKFIFRFK